MPDRNDHTLPHPLRAPEVSVIIVNYETSAFVRRCVTSLMDQQLASEVIVVDNPSPREDWRHLPGPPTIIIRNSENVGYGSACNIGAAHARGEVICILNPDTIVPPGALRSWLNRLRDLLAQGRRVGVLAPMLLNENGTPQRSTYRFPDPLCYWWQHSIFAGFFKALRKRVRLPRWQLQHRSDVRSVDWVMGSAMLIPRSAWNEIGGFSDAYFLYVEDMDLCYRLVRAGYEILYDPQLTLIHTQGHPTGEARELAARRLFEGLETFLQHHYERPARIALRFCVIVDMLWRLAMWSIPASISGESSTHRSRLKAYRHILSAYGRRLLC